MTIIICITIISIVSIICYTYYKIYNNSKLEELYKEVKRLEQEVNDNNKWFINTHDVITNHIADIKELKCLLKNLLKNENI